MEPVTRITPALPDRRLPAPQTPATGAQAAAAPASPSTALVPTQPAERVSLRSRATSAPFLAQLIAAKAQVPQARARRRAAPEEAVAAYAGVDAGAVGPRPGHRYAGQF